MASPSPGLTRWFHEHRAQYNRWADRHTILIWSAVAVLVAFLVILLAARLSHPLPQLPGSSSAPGSGPGHLT
jgi:hypothetical protein